MFRSGGVAVRPYSMALVMALVLVAAGCSAPFKPGGRTAGEELFEAKGCVECHTVDRTRSGSEQELSRVGDKRSVGYISDWLKDPGAVEKKARMPKPDLSDEERSSIVDYLASLK